MWETPDRYVRSFLQALGGGLTGPLRTHERRCSVTGLFVHILPGPGRWAHRTGHSYEVPGTAPDTRLRPPVEARRKRHTHRAQEDSLDIFVGGTTTGRPAIITALCAAAKPSGA